MKHMIIDIGSNSVKYDVFEITDKKFVKVGHHAQVMGFLSYLDNGKLSKKGFSVLCGILNEYKDQAKINGVNNISAFATASFRSCSNPHELIQMVKNTT